MVGAAQDISFPSDAFILPCCCAFIKIRSPRATVNSQGLDIPSHVGPRIRCQSDEAQNFDFESPVYLPSAAEVVPGAAEVAPGAAGGGVSADIQTVADTLEAVRLHRCGFWHVWHMCASRFNASGHRALALSGWFTVCSLWEICRGPTVAAAAALAVEWGI